MSKTGPLSSKTWRLAAAIGLLYALLGFAWIVLSDELVAMVSSEPAWLQTAQRYKGLFYVAMTALALVLLVRAGYAALERAAEQARERDQAQQLASHRALQRQQAQYLQLHQSLAEVLWLATPDGSRLLYLSPAFDALYGRPAADFETDASLWLQAVHPDDRGVAALSHTQLQALGHSSCEYRICRPDGSVRWVSDRKRRIVDDEGRVLMVGGIAEDITAARERDAERESAHAVLEQRVRERTAELERVNAELDAFTRTAAHDLRSPLNAVAGFSHLLRSRHGDALGEGGARMLTHIETSARQMSVLISDLLLLSRLSTLELALKPVDLAGLAREVMDELRLHQPGRQVAFEAPAQLPVCCDPGMARPLLANLLGNAWKFTGKREGALIRLTAEAVEDGVRVSVQDNGAGFDAARAERLFQPFQRFHAASDFDGTGVGLATCRRIVERHGGVIGASSTPGAGATFHFTLPHGGMAESATRPRVTQDCT